MWLIPSSMRSHSALASVCWTSESPPDLSTLELRVEQLPMRNGMPMPPRSFLRSWKRVSWMRRLCGAAIWDDSMGHRFVAEWMPLSLASRASRTASPANGGGSLTNAGYGATSNESFATLVRGSWCSKMSADFFRAEEWIPYSQAWPISGSLRNMSVYPAKTLALRTGGNASSSSGWPTPNTMPDAPNSGLNRGGGVMRARSTPQGLGDRAKAFWPTATVNGNGNVAGMTEKSGDGLGTAALKWPTPDAALHSGVNTSPGLAGSRPNIALMAAKWATPVSSVVKRGDQTRHCAENVKAGKDTNSQAVNWSTPKVSDIHGAKTAEQQERQRAAGNGARDLVTDVALWPTASARDGDPRRGGPSSPDSKHMAAKIERGSVNSAGMPSDDLTSAASYWTPEQQAWPTPSVPSGGRSTNTSNYGPNGEKRQVDLMAVAAAWPTPNARDYKGVDLASRNGGASLGHAVETGEFSHSSRPDLPIVDGVQSLPVIPIWRQQSPLVVSVSGGTTRPDLLSRKRLNPAFVNWMMGWPWFWTHPDVTNSVQGEMVLWHCRLRSQLSDLCGD